MSPNPYYWEELENHPEDPIFSLNENYSHEKAKKRGNKKDDFDYNLYIEKELKKLNTKNMSKRDQKVLI